MEAPEYEFGKRDRNVYVDIGVLAGEEGVGFHA